MTPRNRHRDWLVLDSWNRLHRVVEIDHDELEREGFAMGVAACSVYGRFQVPGVLSRLGLPRCAHCCRAVGVPVGNGNTLNGGIDEDAA